MYPVKSCKKNRSNNKVNFHVSENKQNK